MKLSVLVAATLALISAAAVSPAAARPAKLLVFDNQLNTKVTVQWATSISYRGKSLSSTEEDTGTTTDGTHEFDIPAVNSCGAIRASTTVGWIQGNRSDHRCPRPSLDLTSATTSFQGLMYCANTLYRSCSFWRCTCKTAFSIRVSVLDNEGRTMTLSRPGGFRACGKPTNDELLVAKNVAAKL